MKKIVVHSERCKACQLCIQACPKKIITFSGKLNRNGYEYIQVDEDECIVCGNCYTVCPDIVFELYES